MPTWTKSRKYILSNKRGSIIIEFALMLPIILLITYGMVELSSYIEANNIINKTAAYLGDNITKLTPDKVNSAKTAQDIANIYNASYSSLLPLDPQRACIIVTCFMKSGSSLPIRWQLRRSGSKLTPTPTSKVGPSGGTASQALFGSLPLEDRDSIIVVEVFYRYIPYMTGSYNPLQEKVLYTRIFYRPRSGDLVDFVAS